MVKPEIKQQVDEFLSTVQQLPFETLLKVSKYRKEKKDSPASAFKAAKMSAADLSWSEKRVLDCRAPMNMKQYSPEEIICLDDYMTYGAVAIISRTKLTAEQYRVLTNPFTSVGVTFPPHDSTTE
jgi:hypothetical protein